MKFRNCVFSLIIGLILVAFIPSVSADVIFSAIGPFTITHLFFWPLIFLIEGTIFYFLFRVDLFFNIRLKYWQCLVVFLIANGITTLIGFIFMFINLRIYDFYIVMIFMYILSAIVESSVIFVFLKDKIKKSFPSSLYLSFFVNIYSYFFLFCYYSWYLLLH